MAIHCGAVRELPGHLRREAKAGVHDILHDDASTSVAPPKHKKATATAKAPAETLDAWIKKATATETAETAATAARLQQMQQMQQQKEQQRNLCFQVTEEEAQKSKRPAPLSCEPPAKRIKSCRLASWPEIVAHDRRLLFFDVSPNARQQYEHTPIVHFAAQGKIFLFGKSEVGKDQARSDIGDVQELTSQGPSGGNTPWMEHFFEVPYDTMKTHLAMEERRRGNPAPSANPNDTYTNTF